MVGPELGWVPEGRHRVRIALSGLMRALENLGVVCGLVHGECIDDFDAAPAIEFFLIVQDDKRALALSSWLNKVVGRYEREVKKPLSFTVVSMDELAEYEPSELDKILSEGIQVMGSMEKQAILNGIKQPHVLIIYDLSDLRARERVALRKELFGVEEVKVVGSSVYKTTRDGLIEKVGGARIGRDSLVVPRDKADEVIAFLEKRGARCFVREMPLSPEDIRRMKLRSL